MSESLAVLETRRTEVLRALANLQDMRPGSIVGALVRCGKPNCHCAQADDPGHGPHLRLTYKGHGKTVTEALPHPVAVHKAQQESAEFRPYQQLNREWGEVSEPVCRRRPVAAMLTPQEKKRRQPSHKKWRAKESRYCA